MYDHTQLFLNTCWGFELSPQIKCFAFFFSFVIGSHYIVAFSLELTPPTVVWALSHQSLIKEIPTGLSTYSPSRILT